MARAIGDGLYHLIVDVVVHKEYQGQGYFSKLFKFMIEDLKKNDIKK